MNLIKTIILVLLVSGTSAFAFLPKNDPGNHRVFKSYISYSTLKTRALTVLVNKCNSCHLKKNRSVVFSEKNMEQKAREIRTQVFVKQRMPKGKIKLTSQERLDLKLWLESLNQ